MKKRIPIFLLCALALTQCSHPPKDNQLVIKTAKGEHMYSIEIAESVEERRQGLMGRETLAPKTGMLFVFPALSISPFWMKNTPLSLDIIFISERGTVLQISKDTQPFSETLIHPQEPYRYVLELESGSADTIGLVVNDTIIIPKKNS
jgi:uncharacterized protein